MRPTRTASQDQQRLNGVGYLWASKAVVTVPPLPFDIKQSAFDEFAEMFARCLRRHIRSDRELSCGQSEPAHQSQQNGRSSGIAQQACGTG
jgi:hypothetical protein